MTEIAGRTGPDIARELQKVLDVLEIVDRHFLHEAQMNAALHMAITVRPAPLASAVTTTAEQMALLIKQLEGDDDIPKVLPGQTTAF